MRIYYNENDPYAAAWLNVLMFAGEIPIGTVDTRSIADVQPADLEGYGQCHFFAGLGGWSYALKLAGWPVDRPVWTGSCPCQPYSNAGSRKGDDDSRNLWPYFRRLIGERRPATIFGEQVASHLGRRWLSGVRVDLEAVAYAVGAADLCSSGVGSPQIRQRLYWMGHANGEGPPTRRQAGATPRQGSPTFADGPTIGLGYTKRVGRQDAMQQSGHGAPTTGGRGSETTDRFGDASASNGLADTGQRRVEPNGRQLASTTREGESETWQQWFRSNLGDGGSTVGLGDAGSAGLAVGSIADDGRGVVRHEGQAVTASSLHGFWSRYSVVHCTDGKTRRFEPESFPLAHGAANRVGRLRAYGNAINPQLAAHFIRVATEYIDGQQPSDGS